MTNPTEDLLGNPLSADEQELLDLFERTRAMSRRADLPPVATANLKQAMVLLWNACNDLALIADEPGCD